MVRVTEEERAALRKAKSIQAQRAKLKASGVYVKADREGEVNHLLSATISAAYVVAHDDLMCEDCQRPMILVDTATSELRTRKMWACTMCRTRVAGQYTTYVIQEEPGR
jgi:ribosomal protein L37AE/L43A